MLFSESKMIICLVAPFGRILFLFLLVASAIVRVSAATPGALVTVYASGGQISGKANANGNFLFRGVRYGRAERWEAPTAQTPWTSAVEAFEFQSSCPQICQSVLCPDVISEDCLFMNVYTPLGDPTLLKTSPSSTAAARLPVVIFVHGGSFEEGGAGMAAYDASDLSKSLNAIVVTFNYRLSVFGFFDINAVDSAGTTNAINFGILDQRLAFQWVQDNIAAFGGNATDLTFLGQSAGAQSVIMHMAHPSTQQIVRKAVLMSPPALALTTLDKAQTTAKAVARDLGCTTSACMKGKSMRQVLTAKTSSAGSGVEALSQLVYRSMAPVVDGVDVLMNPFDALAQRPVMQGARIMIGGVSNETSLFVNGTNPGDLGSPLFNVIVEAVFSPNNDAVLDIYESSSADYLASRKPHLMRVTSDWVFVCPQRQSIRASSGAGTVWSYYFEAPWRGGMDEALGNMCGDMACHTTDLSYLFKKPDDVVAQAVTSSFRAYLSEFIAGKDDISPANLPSWNPASANLAQYPIIRFPDPVLATGSYMPILESTHPLSARCDLWDAAGYEYAPLTDTETVTKNKKASAALSLVVLAITLGFLVVIVCTEWLLVIRGLFLQRALVRLFRAVEADEREMAEAVKKLRGQQALLAGAPDANEKQVGLVGKLTDAVSMSIQSLFENEKPTPVLVECRSVTYRAGDSDNGKRLLDAVSVSCLPGTVTAIMGPSGAGKTTLLSLLNRRLKAGSNVEDRILFRGKSLSSMTAVKFRSMTGFVAQHDAPYYGLTVREVMMFNATLELPSTMSNVEKVRRINSQLRLLNLTPCADVVIQRPESNLGGISGGQMRRLSIAVALLKRPSVIFMDEPTSGLDAKSSMDVGRAMTQLASQGYTIICSIHQPRPEMFAMFDQVTVLVYGRLLFSGPPTGCVEYFESLRSKLASRNNNASKSAKEVDDKEADIEVDKAGQKVDKPDAGQQEDGPNPADLVLDVASQIQVADAAWASRQWQPPESDIEYLQPKGADARMDETLKSVKLVEISRIEEWRDPTASVGNVLVAPANSAEILNDTLRIASKYMLIEGGKLVVPMVGNTRRSSEPTLSSSVVQRRKEIGGQAADTFDRLEAARDEQWYRMPPLPPAILKPESSTSPLSTTISASSPNLNDKKVGAGRLWLPSQVQVITGRWWAVRPLARKFNMMIISACGVWILSILQRRSGDDILSLVLQTKGLALACIGLPALKNIHISFDYYEDRDIYNFDSQNGTVTAMAFFLHRVVYETANATLEGFIAVISAYFILGCNPDPMRIGTAMLLFVAYYNCTTTLFTLVYCTRLGRPEARSVAFFSQAVLAIVSGVWIKKGDATVYDWIAWAQYLNPTYWALSPLVRANAAHAGKCLLEKDGYCQASMGDVIAEEARADRISPNEGLLALGIIWLVMRTLQLIFLYRDTYFGAFWTSTKKSWADWIKVQMTEHSTMATQVTQTGDSLEQMPDSFPIGTKGNMVELDQDIA
ncbi:Carboxylesterase family-domain-containing protein [Powellomyces hirtus]|nr:Carboxylesterase family-domain-containing protein [Powellomyces hirtus]